MKSDWPDHRHNTKKKTRTHVFKILNTTNTICGYNCESLWDQVYKQMYHLLITAWQHISPDVMVKGVKKCCMSSAIDETDDDSCGMAVYC